jgi:hypothetical protein
MKKLIIMFAVLMIAIIMLSSCATVLGGRVSSCQRTRPAPEQPAREIRVAALIVDVLIFWPFAIIDIATGAIWKPCETTKVAPN